MFRNILIPLDLSTKAQITVDTAVAVAQSDSPRVTLLHVIETIQDLAADEMEDFYRALRERATETLAHWADHLEQRGFQVQSEIVVGKRALEITHLAEELGCDLIILRSHRVDPDSPTGEIGTISHQVAVLSGCTVLMMK
jgi:universal stress protein F